MQASHSSMVMKKFFIITLLFYSTINANSDLVSTWNEIANKMIVSSNVPHAAAMVDMTYMQVAIYDAVNSIDGGYTEFAVKAPGAVPWASKEAAVCGAAYTILKTFYPDHQSYLDSAYALSLSTITDNEAKTKGVDIGVETAKLFLQQRNGDGRRAEIAYTFGSGTCSYQLTPGAPDMPLTPWLAKLKPFAMNSSSQFRPPQPPDPTSRLYADNLNETKKFGSKTNSARTPLQTEIGYFYTENTANQMSRNIRAISESHNLSLVDNARFFAQVYVTIADGCIAAWDSKYHYNFWRPYTAICCADKDNNALTEKDTAWEPLVMTPAHPEYPAAHGCVSGGFAYALEKFFGTPDIDVTLTSTAVPGKEITEHHFKNTKEMTDEVINARIYGGMHFRNSGETGVKIAHQVADWVAQTKFKKISVVDK